MEYPTNLSEQKQKKILIFYLSPCSNCIRMKQIYNIIGKWYYFMAKECTEFKAGKTGRQVLAWSRGK